MTDSKSLPSSLKFLPFCIAYKPAAFVVIVLCMMLIASCTTVLERQAIQIKTNKGQYITLQVERARNSKERERGYMYRRRITDGEGMLFEFEKDMRLSFWMKNTYVPLSIAYITASGQIGEIYNMKANDLTSVQSIKRYRYALEVPQGWYERNSVTVGSTVSLPD